MKRRVRSGLMRALYMSNAIVLRSARGLHPYKSPKPKKINKNNKKIVLRSARGLHPLQGQKPSTIALLNHYTKPNHYTDT